MSERTRPRTRTRTVWLSLIGVGIAGLLITTLSPRFSEATGRPPVSLLLGVGLVLIAAASMGVYVGIRWGLGLAAKVAVYAVGFNALILLVKFVLAPYGIYDLNRTVRLESFIPFTEPIVTWLTALSVFLLYFAVYGVVYRVVRSRLGLRRDPGPPNPRRRRAIVILSIGGAIVVTAASGLGVLFLPLLPVASGAEYLRYLFSSSVSLAVALALVAATWLAARTFRSAGEQAGAVTEAALLTSLFWVGLSFIALYHFLWVVYLIVLLSIWPLRVVVPK
jgi:hypothetical protein